MRSRRRTHIPTKAVAFAGRAPSGVSKGEANENGIALQADGLSPPVAALGVRQALALAAIHAAVGQVKNNYLAAMLCGVSIWFGVALSAEAPSMWLRPVPRVKPITLVIPCDEEHKRVCNARKRSEKIKANWL
jgi:hypothetical protein